MRRVDKIKLMLAYLDFIIIQLVRIMNQQPYDCQQPSPTTCAPDPCNSRLEIVLSYRVTIASFEDLNESVAVVLIRMQKDLTAH